jgi:hypothetical protein
MSYLLHNEQANNPSLLTALKSCAIMAHQSGLSKEKMRQSAAHYHSFQSGFTDDCISA